MLFSPQRVLIFNDPVSRSDALRQLAATLEAEGLVKASFAEGVLAREAIYPTGIFMETHSIAIPHTEFEHVNQTGFAVGINHSGIEFQRTDEPDETVKPDIIVMMAIDPACEKVAIIQSLFALLADKAKVENLCELAPEDIAKEFTNAVITR
ncbi:PTS glucose transporter subunit IIA [Superficieibacter electus]|uniref:PTS glucose transporter subunit IIA n=1 Tax=Superficieibacter electus TaxID=2022662 RepID=A0A2P5GNK4_9ENTR|nr:PTS sugar transporter subunit IIA [Superficieibacter electus]POP43652.1 PTS glucose transporter subunit IIA [Superficieibacter electus]POP48120.1 PTS glucose transporter subunit IIA [Superficieibacter electus]